VIETGTIPHFEVVLVDSGEWEGLRAWLEATVLADGRITVADLSGLSALSDPDEVVAAIDAGRRRQERRVVRGGVVAETQNSDDDP
jgi:predicted Rossmann-fold nucleotide-binding protein